MPDARARESLGFFASRSDEYAPLARSSRTLTHRPESRLRGKARPTGRQAEKKEAPPPGPHILIISVKSQHVSLYANGRPVAQSPVSTGTATHPTPHGVFSIIQRNRHHRSNIYSGAPMPYMQRLTWSGVALHQGVLPGRPASHGCIRLPEQFASFLWRTTKLGTRVVVSRDDVEPQEIQHARLFQPRPVPTTVETMPALRKTLDTTTPAIVRTAGVTTIATDGAAAEADTATPADAAPANAAVASTATDPAPAPQKADIPDAILASFAQSLQAKQKKTPPSGPISVFVSRKDKRIYVRQGFIPLFTAPVTIRDDQSPTGTHVFTAFGGEDGGKSVRWLAITLPTDAPKPSRSRDTVRTDARGRPLAAKPQAGDRLPPPPSASSVLDRIEIAPDVADRISEYVTAGASLIVSDQGLGHETGLYTDFIVVTR
jgi:hypothetical protein